MVTPPPADPALPVPGAFDGHTHMDMTDVPVEALLDAARAAGIGRVVNVGCDLPSSRWSVAAASSYPEVYAAAGQAGDDSRPGGARRRAVDPGRVRAVAAVFGDISLLFRQRRDGRRVR